MARCGVLTYKDPAEMQKKIDEYFESCEGQLVRDADGNPMIDKWGNAIIINQRPPTVTGLALALGFNSRQTLLNYQGKKAFRDMITRAKSMVEMYTEERLFDKDGSNGAKFSLQFNFKGWREEKSDEATGPTINIINDIPRGRPAGDTEATQAGDSLDPQAISSLIKEIEQGGAGG